MIKVSNFKCFNGMAGEYIVSTHMAQSETISQLGGVLIEDTTIEIDSSLLNGDGLYTPKGVL